MLCRNICFPCRRKKKSTSESRMQSGGFVLQRLLWQWFPSSPPFTFTGKWKGEAKRNFLNPLIRKACDPSRFSFVNRTHWRARRGGSSLAFGAEHLQNHLQNRKGKRGKLIGPHVWGKALYIMLIAHPRQLPFRTNYGKANCEISISFPHHVRSKELMQSVCKKKKK